MYGDDKGCVQNIIGYVCSAYAFNKDSYMRTDAELRSPLIRI